jgi:hypothetical protein
VGCVDLLLAFVLFAKAFAVSPPTEEEKLAREITELATEGLSAELDDAREELHAFMKSTRRLGEIAQQLTSIAGGPVSQLFKILTRPG